MAKDKTGKKRQTDKREEKTKKQKNLKSVTNVSLPIFNQTNNSSNLRFTPCLEEYVSEQISPMPGTNLSSDNLIIFDFNVGANEYGSFPEDFQAVLEVETYYVKKTSTTETTELVVDNDGIYFPPATAGLSLFEAVTAVWQFSKQDISNHYPFAANFLNWHAASELYFSSPQWISLQNARGNTIPLNTENTADYINLQKSKLHDDQSDKHTATRNGKFLYLTIPMFPFRLTSPFFANKYKLSKKPLFPPLTKLKIIFKKQTNFPQKYLMDYVKFGTDVMAKNSNLTDAHWQWGPDAAKWSLLDVKTTLLNMHLCVERISVDQKSDPLKDSRYLTFKFSYSRFILSPLTPHTSQELELRWDINRLPLTVELFFVRDQDLIHNPGTKCPASINRFLLPPKLESFEIRYKDKKEKLLDNLKIDQLNSPKISPSKLNYFNYLKLHSFIGFNEKIEDYFSTAQEVSSLRKPGNLNLFPVDLTGRNLETNIITRGLIMFLKFSSTLQNEDTKWHLCSKYNYIKNVHFTKIPNNIEVTYDNP